MENIQASGHNSQTEPLKQDFQYLSSRRWTNSSDMASFVVFFFHLTWDSLKWNIVTKQEPALPLGILCIMSWNLSRSNIGKHPEIKLGNKTMSSPRQKWIAPYPCFLKFLPCTTKLLENLFLPKPRLLPLITGSHSRPVTQHLNRENSPGWNLYPTGWENVKLIARRKEGNPISSQKGSIFQ